MKCADIKELLYDFMKNELSPARAALVKQHIKECPECERRYIETKGLNALFTAESQAPPKKILKNLRKRYKTSFFPAGAAKPAFALLAVLMLLAGSLFISQKYAESGDRELDYFLYDSYNIAVEYYHDEQTDSTRVADFYEFAAANY